MAKTRIGLFGGSFNPVHKGHVAIAEAFLSSEHIDKLWVLLTSNPPHKEGNVIASYELRHKMLQAAFSEVNNITISTVEQNLPKPNYTIETVRHLKMKYPEFQILYCLGEDSLVEFENWMKYKELLEECELLVAKRPGFDHSKVDPEILNHTFFVEHIPVDISSTAIRSGIKKGDNISTKVPKKVLDIIRKERLYI